MLNKYRENIAAEIVQTWQANLDKGLFSLTAPTGSGKTLAILNAAVLMDEVQAIPLKYWAALRQLFQAVAQSLGTRFVLLTATRPLILRPIQRDAVGEVNAIKLRILCRVGNVFLLPTCPETVGKKNTLPTLQ